MANISEKIFKLRKEKGLTQESLGNICGVSSQAVSKWEKGESLPDILILPILCEALNTTIDELLEVKKTSQQQFNECISSYVKEKDEYQAVFDAILATSYLNEKKYGCAKMTAKGIKIHNTKGLGIIISGHEMLQKIKETNPNSIKIIIDLITNENIISIIRILDFGVYLNEEEIANKCNLSKEDTLVALLSLVKHNICEYNEFGQYGLGPKCYIFFAILAGLYLFSPDGKDEIGNITFSYLND